MMLPPDVHGKLKLTFLLLLALQFARGIILPPSVKTRHYYEPGDINLGLLAPITQSSPLGECDRGLSEFAGFAYPQVEAFLYGVEKINNNPDVLPNITLGQVILDDCQKGVTALKRVIQFLPDDDDDGTCHSRPSSGQVCNNSIDDVTDEELHHFKVSAVVGPSSSSRSVMTSPLLSVYQIPHMSCLATSDELSDKKRFEYFTRVIPPDRFMVEGMVEFLLRMSWSYMSVVHDDGSYGIFAVKELKRHTKRHGLCIAQTIPVSSFHVDRAISFGIMKKLQKIKSARVVLLFLPSSDINQILLATEELGLLGHFIYVATEAGDRLMANYPGRLSHGVLYMQHYFPKSTELQERYLRLSPWDNERNPWIRELWQQQFNCHWEVDGTVNKTAPHCDSFNNVGEALKPAQVFKYARFVVDAVYVFSKAFDSVIRQYCADAFMEKSLLKTCLTGSRILNEILHTNTTGMTGRLQFDELGDNMGTYQVRQILYEEGKGNWEVLIGQWDKAIPCLDLWKERISWKPYQMAKTDDGENDVMIHSDVMPPESVCSKQCKFREYRVQQELPCCWACHKCRVDEILINKYTKCARCPEFYWPDDKNETKCVRITPEHLVMTSPVSVIFLGLALVGIGACAVIAGIFLKYQNERLIKASSVSLSFMILLGISLAFFSSLPLLATPNTSTSTSVYFGFTLSCTIIYSPLLYKTNRIYRVFSAGRKGIQRVKGISSSAQLVFSTCTILLQVAVTILSTLVQEPEPQLRMRQRLERHVELLCHLPLETLLPPLSFNLLLLFLCAYYGFLTRRLPENFNESWYIFVSVSTTSFLWMVFLPSYFTAFRAYHQVVLMASCLILNGYVTMLCQYVTKIYALFMVDEQLLTFHATEATQSSTMSAVAPAPQNMTVSTIRVPEAENEQHF